MLSDFFALTKYADLLASTADKVQEFSKRESEASNVAALAYYIDIHVRDSNGLNEIVT